MKKKGDINLSDKIKEQVRILKAEGYSNNYISKGLKISWDSVNKIIGQEDNFESFREHKKRKMAESLWDLAIQAKEKITAGKLKDSSAARLVIVLATLIDKALLLTGEVTERLGIKTEPELSQELKELEVVERELKIAWEKAEKKRLEAEAKSGKS